MTSTWFQKEMFIELITNHNKKMISTLRVNTDKRQDSKLSFFNFPVELQNESLNWFGFLPLV